MTRYALVTTGYFWYLQRQPSSRTEWDYELYDLTYEDCWQVLWAMVKGLLRPRRVIDHWGESHDPKS